MREPIRSVWGSRFRALILAAALLAGCATTKDLRPRPLETETAPQVIALTRVVFGGERPDPFCELGTAEEIRWRVRRELEGRGYTVVSASLPPSRNTFGGEEWAEAPAEALLAFLPDGADAILRVTVAHYLAHDLCPREDIATLELGGRAELFIPGNLRAVWRSRADAHGTSLSPLDDLPFQVGSRFGQNLMAPFPPLRGESEN